MRPVDVAAFLRWRDTLTLERLAAALLFVTVATIACLMPVQSDTWWQLRAGQDFWQSGAIPLQDTYSHTVNGQFWMNHEWLSEVLFYGLFHLGGLPLVTALAALLVIASVGLSWSLMTGSTLLKLALMGAAVSTLSIAWTPRPHVFTLFLLAVCTKLLVTKRYLWLPLLFLAWANLHGGFTLGILLVGGAMIAALPEGPREMRTRALVLAACVAVTVVTPLGFAFWEELPASLARLREYQVLEWRRASLTNFSLLPFWFAATALVALTGLHGRFLLTSPTDRLITIGALLLIPLGLNSIRNIPPFLLVGLPAITRLLPVAVLRERDRPVGHTQANAHVGMLAVASLLAVVIVATAWGTSWQRLQWEPVPAEAIQAVESCQGPLYNSYDDGGYLIWFAPDRKVFIDSRQDPYPVDLVQQDMRAQIDGEYRDTFAQFGVRCAFLRSGALLTRRLHDDGWIPLYAGLTWSVYEESARR